MDAPDKRQPRPDDVMVRACGMGVTPSYEILRDGRVIVTHAGADERATDETAPRVKSERQMERGPAPESGEQPGKPSGQDEVDVISSAGLADASYDGARMEAR